MKRTLILIFISIFLQALNAQNTEFAAPIDIPLVLNGNFGELRSNHFHAGIDLKTQGKTGLPVYCIEDGFVSRVAVSSGGYGNALYVEHPSGYTSVFGHLESFNPEIDQWVKEQQYQNESFVVNLFPEKNQFKYSQGDMIAKTGNTGSSGGPHLHFEIRKTANQNPVNPLFFNFDIKDKTKPTVQNLYVYPLTNNSHVQQKTSTQHYSLVYYDGKYHLKGIPSLAVFGEIGFGVDAIDYLDGNWSKCGIYQMELWIDDQLINMFQIDELIYDEMRYMNSHIDYATYQKSRKRVHKTFIDPGNKLSIYEQTKDRGTYTFDDNARHSVQIKLYDVYMNLSIIEFKVKATTPIKHEELSYTEKFVFTKENNFTTSNFEIKLPEGALYKNIDFDFDTLIEMDYAPLYRVHNKNTPLHKYSTVKINGEKLPKQLQEKALISIYSTKYKKHYSLGGKYENGWVTTSTRTFGDMTIVVDTISPTIQSLSIKNKTTLAENKIIRFKIKDNLSGIKSYRGTIDGKWVLFKYDAKRSLLYYNFDEHISSGQKHNLQLVVTDNKENKSVYNATFYY